jgi:hypothetical protein
VPDGGQAETPKDLTLEINASHPTIINLNTLRKSEPDFAKDICLIFLDGVLSASNIPGDLQNENDRKQSLVS